MKIEEALIRGYYDEETGKDYTIEIDTNKFKEWLKQEKLDLLDFENNIEQKLNVYDILEERLTKNLSHYANFTVKFQQEEI